MVRGINILNFDIDIKVFFIISYFVIIFFNNNKGKIRYYWLYIENLLFIFVLLIIFFENRFSFYGGVYCFFCILFFKGF